MLYDQLTETEKDRITNWLCDETEWREGGWIIAGLVHLEWNSGWYYVVEVEDTSTKGCSVITAHLVPTSE